MFAPPDSLDTPLTSPYELKDRGDAQVTTTITRAMLTEAAVHSTGLSKPDIAAICDSMCVMMAEDLMAGHNVKLTAFGSLAIPAPGQSISYHRARRSFSRPARSCARSLPMPWSHPIKSARVRKK
jgi:hypothetical protein